MTRATQADVTPVTAGPAPAKRASRKPPPLPKPAAPPPVAEPAAEAEPAEESPEQAVVSRSFMHGASSWLTSFVVHLVVVLALALVTTAVVDPAASVVFVTAAVIEDVAFEEIPEFQATLGDVDTSALAAASVSLTDLGEADWGETLSTAVVDSDSPELPGGIQADLGALFGSSGQGLAEFGKGLGGGAEFFGVKAQGVSFVFVVDSSNSMRNGKFDAAKLELLAAVKRLKSTQSFYVVFFDWDMDRMFNRTSPELRPVRASEENIRKLEYWLPSVQNELKTRPLEAMKFALSLSPDAIYFLTDGNIQDDTEGYLKQNNALQDPIYGRRLKVAVHTVGFWSASGQDVLKSIARDNNGSYRYVPPPPGKAAK